MSPQLFERPAVKIGWLARMLAAAIQADCLQWDPSILGLLSFSSVLDMMARDPAWTEQLDNAVLNQRREVMDAVQRQRRLARQYGYLAPNGYVNALFRDVSVPSA